MYLCPLPRVGLWFSGAGGVLSSSSARPREQHVVSWESGSSKTILVLTLPMVSRSSCHASAQVDWAAAAFSTQDSLSLRRDPSCC